MNKKDTLRVGQDIEKAAELIQKGELVALPTETVYGLGALARSEAAIEKLYSAKGRPTDHPVIVHICEPAQINDWACDIADDAMKLADAFWPGPLTIILKKKASVSYKITGGQDTVALRIPSHPLTLETIKKVGSGIAAPSANKFGRLSPTEASDVDKEFGDELAYVLDGGTCDIGIESTIVNLTGNSPEILRPGHIDKAALEAVLGREVRSRFEEADTNMNTNTNRDKKRQDEQNRQKSKEAVRVPGALPQHYAPAKPLYLVKTEELAPVLTKLKSEGKRVSVLAFCAAPTQHDAPWLVSDRDARDFARKLYSRLRELDAANCDCILVESPPTDTAQGWAGIKDRLTRASSPTPFLPIP
ncbi:threonylcarbamoyl-AMP synthase [bacterium]|nr:threonylcarbamoyl-AMP synthase [bacterium]